MPPDCSKSLWIVQNVSELCEMFLDCVPMCTDCAKCLQIFVGIIIIEIFHLAARVAYFRHILEISEEKYIPQNIF